ncbi:MAG: helix-turn-helix domain-containing protein [Lachnospiraceae bacterium]|nr:helix-turn-helix domain-containing protein [Lachnospiraceae bacterium]
MNIREIRKRTGLSQAKFGEAYHIPKRTIEDWETGKRIPPVYVVEMLERITNEDFPEKEGDE